MRRNDQRDDDAGFTLVELIVASALLMLALAGFVGALGSLHNTTSYQVGRTRALDDLRITAGVFAKDARHAREVVAAEDDSVEMLTYVNGVEKLVTYSVEPDGDGTINLERLEEGGSPRLFVIRLTSDSIFQYDSAAPSAIRRVNLHMETEPSPKYPPVVLETEVALRNVG